MAERALQLAHSRSDRKVSQTLADWIHEVRSNLVDRDGALTMLVMTHEPDGKEVHHCKLGGSPGRTDAELASVFFGCAKSYGEELPGVQTFQMHAFFNDQQQAQAFKPFVVGGRTEFDGLMTEGAHPTGSLAQGMRLTELLVQGCFRQMSSIHAASQQMIDSLLGDLNSSRQRESEAFEVARKLLVEHERMQNDRRMEEMRYARESQEREMWMKFAPPLINTVLGKEIFPQSVADTALIDSIANHLSEEQIEMLATSNLFPPVVWGPLAQRLDHALKKKEEERARVRELTSTSAIIRNDDPDAGNR